MYLNVDFKYRQVLSLLELLAMGISFTPTKATSDLKKKKKNKDDNLDFDAKIFCGERVYLIIKHHWALGSPEFYAVKYGCAKLVKTDIENEKDELNFKIKEKHVAYVWWYIFLVFACWSGLLNGAQKSGKGKTLGTRQVIHSKCDSTSLPRLHQYPFPHQQDAGRSTWCQYIQAAMNQRTPFGSSHVEKIRAYF